MNIKLLSYYINEKTPTYGNQNSFKLQNLSSIESGATANSSKWILQTNHVGTHIDFPLHFCSNGKSSNDYKPDFWIFNRVGVIESSIENFSNELDKLSEDIEILIWKSGFGQFRNDEIYWKSQPVIPSFFADLIKKKLPNVRIFGFDMISLTSKLDRDEGKKAHIKFLCDHEILIIEDMNLNDINKSTKFKKIIVSPLLVSDTNGSPCSIFGFL
tara:strand:- start:8784 stop:9425 length:642 start_codon:yes stop_codon:yes gene_type:complete